MSSSYNAWKTEVLISCHDVAGENVTSRRKNVPVAELIDLSGRGAIVTGGASGIGLAICHAVCRGDAICHTW